MNSSEGLLAWVAFGKTGSSSLRDVLERRIEARDWTRYTPPGENSICHAYKLMSASRSLPCADVPEGYVLQTLHGFCELLAAVRPERRCRYMTLLRDPIERVISEWNYFCVGCAEGGRMCANSTLQRMVDSTMGPAFRSAGLPNNTCPSMSLTDYATLSGNRYTAEFSRTDDTWNGAPTMPLRHSGNSGHDPWEYSYTPSVLSAVFAGWRHLGESEYRAALARLTSPSLLVLFSETLTQLVGHNGSTVGSSTAYPASATWCDRVGFARLSSFLGERVCPSSHDGHVKSNVNTHKVEDRPSPKHLRSLERALAWDIRLHRELRLLREPTDS